VLSSSSASFPSLGAFFLAGGLVASFILRERWIAKLVPVRAVDLHSTVASFFLLAKTCDGFIITGECGEKALGRTSQKSDAIVIAS
jgi:hypothetical protein